MARSAKEGVGAGDAAEVAVRADFQAGVSAVEDRR